MARKRIGTGDDPRTADEDSEREKDEIAREIGRLQKRARERDREDIKRWAKNPAPRRAVGPKRRLFSGGAKASSLSETHDDAFRAADLMRSRLTREDERGEVERYKRGPKKGQPKFKQAGSLAEENQKKLRGMTNKAIRIRVKFDHVRDGGKYRKTLFRTREIVYADYGDLIRAYQDTMRTAISSLGSSDSFEVETIEWSEAPPPRGSAKPQRGKRTKGKAKRKKKTKRPARKRERKSRAEARDTADDNPPPF